jgi:molybdopterin converting factor small subunit
MPQVKLKLHRWLLQSFGDETADTEEVLIRAEEGASILTLFGRLAAENGPFWKTLFDAKVQLIHPNVLVILNGRIVNPYQQCDTSLKEGDELTLLPMMDGG